MEIEGFNETQQKILHYLMQEKDGVTIERLSNLLNISRSAIYQHMTALGRDGYVEKSTPRQTKGRPGIPYVLTKKGEHVFPKQYNLFAELLINLIMDKLGSEELIIYLQELGVSISETKKEALKGKTLDEKIKITVAIMQELGYDANTVENEQEQDYIIDAYNCIFHDLAYKNNIVCELDISLLSSLLDKKIEHVCCMAKGDKRCRFKISSDISHGVQP